MACKNPCPVRAKKQGRLASALLLLSVSQLVFLPCISAAYAQQQASDFNFAIPAQPLSQGLVRFSSVTGIDVLFDGAVPAQARTPGVAGRLPAANALNQLLGGTGFSWRFTGPNTVLLSRPQAEGAAISETPADGAMVLDTITIRGGAGGRTGTLGALADDDANYRNAGSSAFLNEERIQRFRGSSVGDFIKGTPGVLTGDNRNSGAVDVNIRGMQGFGRVPVIIDGTQQQNTVYRGYSGVTSRNYVDPDLIGGAVIEKGPSANVYGVGATGGPMRMETLNADDIIRGDKNWGVRLRGGIMGNTSTPPAVGTPGGYPPLKQSRFITECNWACRIDTIPASLLTGSPYGMDRPSFLEPASGSGSAALPHATTCSRLLQPMPDARTAIITPARMAIRPNSPRGMKRSFAPAGSADPTRSRNTRFSVSTGSTAIVPVKRC